MKRSWKLGTFAGIGVYVHWTFALLLIWVVGVYLSNGSGWIAAAQGTALLLAVFVCVVLHEFGHALTARRFDIVTKDITLLPIGGLARLERIPENPLQELAIALAGPAVNVVIAAGLLGVLLVMGQIGAVTALTPFEGRFLVGLMWINVFLAGFNLLPAFPMDGGRVLRAILATRMSHLRATEIAAGFGRVMAVLFAVAGLFLDWWLLLIAAFVYFAAEGELAFVRQRAIMRGATLGEAMTTRFATVKGEQTIDDAIGELRNGSQRDLPVVDEGRPIGLLSGDDVVRAIGDGHRDALVSRYMHQSCPVASESEPIQESYRRMLTEGWHTLPIVRNGQLVGLVTPETIKTWMSIRRAAGGPGKYQVEAPANGTPVPNGRNLDSPRGDGQQLNRRTGAAIANWHPDRIGTIDAQNKADALRGESFRRTDGFHEQ